MSRSWHRRKGGRECLHSKRYVCPYSNSQ